MRVILINSSNYAYQTGMPLGLMTISAELERLFSIQSTLIDLPLEDEGEDEIDKFVQDIDVSSVRFVGLSTMCNTFPRTLSVARAIKNRWPNLPIVLGGPQATTNTEAILSNYAFIDCIVVGEVETVLEGLVRGLAAPHPANQPGLLFRQANVAPNGLLVGQPVEMAPLADIDSLPDLQLDTYPPASRDKRVSIEVGRGCPYGCTFCSTKSFFQRRFRLKRPQTILRQIRAICEERGTRHFDFIHDMFTTNRKLVVEICEELLAADLDIKWGCSARTDRVDGELLRLMVESGCKCIFFGIESGSDRIQRIIHKNLVVSESLKTIREVHELGLDTIASLIIGFPDEEEKDLLDTVSVALDLRSWRPALRGVQVHMLSPLSGTELTPSHLGDILYDGCLTDISSVKELSTWEQEQILLHPDLFSSFYYIPNPRIPRKVYLVLYWLLFYGVRFDTFFRLLVLRFGRSAASMLLDLARCEDELLPELMKRNERIALPAIGKCLRRFVHTFDCSPLEQALCKESLEFDLWKSHTCREVAESPLHLSGIDFLAADSMSFADIIGSYSENRRFVYSIASSGSSIRCLRISDELCSLLSTDAVS